MRQDGNGYVALLPWVDIDASPLGVQRQRSKAEREKQKSKRKNAAKARKANRR